MTQPGQPKLSTLDVAVMLVCAIIGGSAVLGFLFGAFLAVYVFVMPDSKFMGVGIISGVLLAAMGAVVAAIVLPGAAPPGWRAKAYGLSSAIFGILVLLAWAALTILG